MDLQYFFKVLLRRKWLLLLAMIIAVALAWFLVGLQETTYKSKSIISTGIIDQRSINLEQDNPFIQKFIVESKFSILTELFKNRNSIRLLTHRLLRHDLNAEMESQTPFRTPIVDEENPLEYTTEEILEFAEGLNTAHDSLFSSQSKNISHSMFEDLAKAYEYDYQSLTKNLNVKRIGDTDYVSVEFESENPELSTYIVNNFVKDFINYNERIANSDKMRTVNFYIDLSKNKKGELDDLNRRITNFKQNRSIIDLEEQSKSTIGQIKDLELTREETQKDIRGIERSIENYNKYIDKDKLQVSSEYSSDIFLNGDVKDLKNQIDQLNDQYISGGMKNSGLKQRIEERKKEYLKKVKDVANESTLMNRRDKKANSPETILAKRIDAEAELAIAEEGVKSIDNEIERLRQKATSFVSADAFLEALDGEKEIVLNEYLNVTEKLNEAQRITQTYTSPLSIVEYGELPEKPEPSNRLVISIFAGIAAVSLCTLLIFLLTLFDSSLNSPAKFEQFAKVPLIGSLNKIKNKRLDFQELFEGSTKDKRLINFKESLRKIRYTIENSGANSFLFTSTKEQEGKTFALIALAYSLSMNNKKVLVIDTNFKNNTLTDMSNKTLANNPLNNGFIGSDDNNTSSKALKTQLTINNNVDIIGNKGGNHSPSEILAGKNFRRVLEGFSTKYDYIFLESAAINHYADARELAPYVDKVIAVFDAAESLNSTDRESIEFLENLNGKFMGGILNNVDLKNLS